MTALPNQRLDHPLFTGKTSVGMISGEAPRFPAKSSGHQALGEALKQMGIKHEEREGMYGAPEKSYMLYGANRDQMYQLGKMFGQESVIYSNGGRHELLYTNGPNAGRFHPSIDHEFFNQPPEDYYTNMPELGGYLRLNFDWNKLHPTNLSQDAAVQALHDRNAAQTHQPPPEQADRNMVKAEVLSLLKMVAGQKKHPEHPLAYDWHNEHTDHHLHVMAPGAVLRGRNEPMAKAMPAHPHMDGSKPPEAQQSILSEPPKNDQAAGVGVSTYAKYAMPYGGVDKSASGSTDLFHYPYHGKNQDIDRLVKDHGFTTYYAGGKHGRPDLANRNYNTKHLMVYDPSPGSGGDFGTEAYTDGWRKIHELSHALVYPELNAQYGEGRRIGKLGNHRTMREALRAVHWEWLAAHKQRELSKQIGVDVPDHVFNKELNTVMHDAIHRAVTGKFTEPSGEGFRPHEHRVPLEHALGMVREAAHNLGITGMHDLIKKNESEPMADEKKYDAKEWRLALAKGLRDRVDAYSKQMLELRQRELAKAEPALQKSMPALNPLDACPLCGMEDVPGKCKCLQGPLAKSAPLSIGMQPAVKKETEKNEGGSMAALARSEMCKSCGKSHEMNKCGLSEVKPGPKLDKGELPASQKIKTKAKEPVKPADGNGIDVKPLKKIALPSVKVQAKQQGLVDASKAAAAAPKMAAPAVKLPSPDEHAKRAATFADHTPAAKPAVAPAPAAGPKLTGMAKIAAVGAQPLGGAPKIPGMAPKAPGPGVGGLKPPPAPMAAGPKPAMAPSKPALPMAKPRQAGAAPAPAMKAELKPEDEPAPVKKALPKTDAENDANRLAFPSADEVSRDHFLENSPVTKVTTHTAKKPAAKLPNVEVGDPVMPEFMSSPAAGKGHVKKKLPTIAQIHASAQTAAKKGLSIVGDRSPREVEDATEHREYGAVNPDDDNYNPASPLEGTPADKKLTGDYWRQIDRESTPLSPQHEADLKAMPDGRARSPITRKPWG